MATPRCPRPTEGPRLPRTVAGLAGGQPDDVDERRGGRLADDHVDHQPGDGGAGADGVHPAGLPAGPAQWGALADILDRRRYFAATQLWVSLNALVLAALSLAGLLTAPVLLALTFSNGIGLALRWPVFAAIVPQIVSRAELPAALALNGIAMNLSRVVGPVLAGALLAAFSPAVVFVLNTVLAAGPLCWSCAGRARRAPAPCRANVLSARCAWA
jgi:MFS family permease